MKTKKVIVISAIAGALIFAYILYKRKKQSDDVAAAKDAELADNNGGKPSLSTPSILPETT